MARVTSSQALHSRQSIRSPLSSSIAAIAASAVSAVLLAHSAQAASGTWTGTGVDDLWSNTGNWLSGTIAGATFSAPAAITDIATFNSNPLQLMVGIDTNRFIRSLSFDTAAGPFSIGDAGTNGGPTLNLGTGGTIQMLATMSGSGIVETVNAPLLLQPSAAAGNVTYTFQNNSADPTNILNVAGSFTSGTTGAGTGIITLTGANTGSNTISGAIVGTAAGNFQINKSGAGSWTIAGPLTTKGTGVPGGMAVTGGTINFSNTAAVTLTGKVTINGGSVMNSSGTVALTTGALDYFTVGDGSDGRLNVTGGGFTVTPDLNRALVIGTADSPASATGIVNISAGTFTLGNNSPVRFGNWDTTNTKNGTGILTISGTGTFTTGATTGAFILGNGSALSSGTINLDGGTFETRRSITKGPNGGATINFNGGVLKPTTTSTTLIASTITTNVKAGGAVIDTNTFNLTLPSALQADPASPGGGLTKKSTGTLTLTGASTYTGPTVIEAGTLTLGATGSIAASSEIEVRSGASFNVSAMPTGFTVASGKVLSGSGSITGNVILGDGAILAPGSSAGTLDINGSLSFSENSVLSLEITGATAGDGLGFYDQVNMTALTGSVLVDPAAQLALSLSGFSPSITDKFFVLTRADTANFSGFFAGAPEGATVSLGGGYTASITYEADSGTSQLVGGNDVAIYSVVPEPAGASLLLSGLGCLLGFRRSSRRR